MTEHPPLGSCQRAGLHPIAECPAQRGDEDEAERRQIRRPSFPDPQRHRQLKRRAEAMARKGWDDERIATELRLPPRTIGLWRRNGNWPDVKPRPAAGRQCQNCFEFTQENPCHHCGKAA